MDCARPWEGLGEMGLHSYLALRFGLFPQSAAYWFEQTARFAESARLGLTVVGSADRLIPISRSSVGAGHSIERGRFMRGWARQLLVVCLACSGVWLGGWSASSWAEAPSPAGESGASGSLAGSLVVPGVQGLDEGQQVLAQQEAVRSSPEAVVAREGSRTKFEGLGPEQVEKLAGEAFRMRWALKK